jgi:hypothetical protein
VIRSRKDRIRAGDVYIGTFTGIRSLNHNG